jgi:diguanylate cyclase
VITSARQKIAGEEVRPHPDSVRRSLVVPIVVVVAAAIVCLAVAVFAAGQHADAALLRREQSLIRQAVADRATQVLRELDSIATTANAATAIRADYDPEWIAHGLVAPLQTFFGDDIVIVIDGSDEIKYPSRDAPGTGAADTIRELAGAIALLRHRASAMPAGLLPVTRADDPLKPGRHMALIQRFGDRPALVAATAIGSDAELAPGNDGAPIVFAIKYIDAAVMADIAARLQLSSLDLIDGQPHGAERLDAIVGAAGNTIARFAFTPMQPGGEFVARVLPFIAVAIAGFAVLAFLIIRHMRRTAQTIAAGETQLRHLALHDPVSGLPNRICFGERLERAIEEVRRGGPSAAAFYIDLDHFKDVNDTLGHHIGDELILNVTQRLSRVVRGNDLVARLGGDEFGIITNCASDSYSLQAIAGRIIAAVCAPYAINGHNIMIGASVGIAVIDRRARDAADILRYADMALYRAKNEGRNRACIYDAAMDADLSKRKLLEGDLLQAIHKDDLRAAYQPIVNASGDTVVGVEALARWTHPTAGEIPPSDFIPVAEHSGIIIELGEWMLRRACLDGRDWPDLTVAVNVSPLQFRRSEFVDVVERILAETRFDPAKLELELTESTLLGNLETAELSMMRLKAIGVRFALDDFGTGYSSLLYLRRFPFDKLKIDSSFVRAIEKAPDAAAIVHAVVSLGRGLGMKVTAEGVENAEQHLFLRAAGVHSMQGYRFGRPGPADDITKRLASPNDYRVRNPDEEIALAS